MGWRLGLDRKGEQAPLPADLQLFCSEPPADCRDWRTAGAGDFGEGRLEIGELVPSPELNELLAGPWAGEAPVFRLTRTVIEEDQTRTEVGIGIIRLSPPRAFARLLPLVRQHWNIK